MRILIALSLVGGFCVGNAHSASAAVLYGPTPYLSFAADSPFSGVSFQQFYLEDFEDGLANTPGLVVPAGTPVTTGQIGSTFVDSVAEDFGPGDGFVGSAMGGGHGVTGQPIVISFDSNVLGFLPTHVGIVVTDLQVFNQLVFMAPVTVEAFGPGAVSLGSITDPNFGDTNTVGGTAEDRFFGFFDLGGIESISINSTQLVQMESDHIQYGTVLIPEPASILLLCTGVLGVGCYHRLRRRQYVA